MKSRIFKLADAALPQGAILASNTSSISITRLAAATGRPELVIGMHFMNPVPLMKLVEIVRGVQTSDATYEAVRALAVGLGKTVITSKDQPGLHREPDADPVPQRGVLRARRRGWARRRTSTPARSSA